MEQHKVILQSLYSGKALMRNVAFFDRLLAQARADVLKALLFGNTIVVSAESFYDSPIAICVFGELFQALDADFCIRQGWRPLELQVETRTQVTTPQQFLIERWSNPNPYFALFRASDPDLEPGDRLDLQRRAAARLQSKGDYNALRRLFEPLYAAHRLDAAPGPLRSLASREIRSLLNEDVISGLNRIERYLMVTKQFKALQQEHFDGAVKAFSPTQAIERRAAGLLADERRALRARNAEFIAKQASAVPMSVYLREGPSIYGEQFDLTRFWVEKDWHVKRLRAYGAASCVSSSDYEAKTLFDSDTDLKEFYEGEHRLDDSQPPVSERLFELDWSILGGIVSDDAWKAAVIELRDAKTRAELLEQADRMLALLHEKLVDFEIENKKGIVSITGKRLVAAAAAGSLAFSVTDAVAAHMLHMPLADFALLAGAPMGAFGAAYGTAKATKTLWKAVGLSTTRFGVERIVDWQLRKSVIPRRESYLPKLA